MCRLWICYDEVDLLRAKHGCTAMRVLRLSGDAKDLLVTHDFPAADQASGFTADPGLGEAMQQAGVDGPPQS